MKSFVLVLFTILSFACRDPNDDKGKETEIFTLSFMEKSEGGSIVAT